jgi:hypothetical protein
MEMAEQKCEWSLHLQTSPLWMSFFASVGILFLAMRATCPTARPPHALAHLIEADSYAVISGFIFPG